MIRRPPRSTRTDPLFPYTTLFRAVGEHVLKPCDKVLAAGLDRPFDHLRIGEGEIGGADRLDDRARCKAQPLPLGRIKPFHRSEEHTSELQSLMRISYAVFCLKKQTTRQENKSSQEHICNTLI